MEKTTKKIVVSHPSIQKLSKLIAFNPHYLAQMLPRFIMSSLITFSAEKLISSEQNYTTSICDEDIFVPHIERRKLGKKE